MSRDPFGIKPLYFAETAAGLIFASEPQAILATGLVERTINVGPRIPCCNCNLPPAPPRFSTASNACSPAKVLPSKRARSSTVAASMRCRARLKTSRRREADALAELDRVLTDSVRVHQRSDVAFGMFLSGGIDSATLLTLMARLNDKPVRAYTATFPAPMPLTNPTTRAL